MTQETKLEQVLEEKGQVSETEVSEEVVEEKAKGEEVKAEPEDFETRVQKGIQAGIDTQTNTYREKRESDAAYIRSLQTENKELQSEKDTKPLSKAMKAVLAGDEEEGLEVNKIAERKKGFAEIKEIIEEYNEKSTEVKEVATLATSLSGKVDKRIADKFDLFDSNPSVRAKGAISLISDAVFFLNEREAFNRILDEIPLLQKGEEVRKQIDSFVERYMELSDEKGKDLLINQLKQELKVTPRKKPPAPSEVTGGTVISDSPADKVTRGLEEKRKGK